MPQPGAGNAGLLVNQLCRWRLSWYSTLARQQKRLRRPATPAARPWPMLRWAMRCYRSGHRGTAAAAPARGGARVPGRASIRSASSCRTVYARRPPAPRWCVAGGVPARMPALDCAPALARSTWPTSTGRKVWRRFAPSSKAPAPTRGRGRWRAPAGEDGTCRSRPRAWATESACCPLWTGAALAGECAKVRTTAPGGRNHAVNRAAFKLARLVVVGELGEAEITSALAEAAATAGLGQVEAAHAIASGLAAGQDPTRHHTLARRQGGAR